MGDTRCTSGCQSWPTGGSEGVRKKLEFSTTLSLLAKIASCPQLCTTVVRRGPSPSEAPLAFSDFSTLVVGASHERQMRRMSSRLPWAVLLFLVPWPRLADMCAPQLNGSLRIRAWARAVFLRLGIRDAKEERSGWPNW